MATIPPPAPGLNQMPEEILCQILAPLLPLKWYSLSTLIALSETSSYLRTFLMQDDTLWHRALLGRAMGRPLHTIPGYAGSAEYEDSLRKALEVVKGGGSAKNAIGAGGQGGQTGGAAAAASLMGFGSALGGGGGVGFGAGTGAGTGMVANPSITDGQENGSEDGSGANNAKLSKSQKKKLKEKAKKQAEKAQVTGGGGGEDGSSEHDSALDIQEISTNGSTIAPPHPTGLDPHSPIPSNIHPSDLQKILLPAKPNPAYTSNGYLVPPPPSSLPPSSTPSTHLSPHSNAHLPRQSLPPLTFRDLAMRIHSHETRCVNCKVADSKLSHYYVTDEELRSAEKMGVNRNVVDVMSRLCGGKEGEEVGERKWGEGKFVAARLDRVLNPKEAAEKAVRTAKFFVGYDFFGFCQYTLAIRIKSKSEPLTQPALARIEIIVFVPAKAVITITHAGVQMPAAQEVVCVGKFAVENWGGVTLGDFQVAFEKWVNEPMTPEENKLYETKCSNGRTKGKLHTRVSFIPASYSARFRMDEAQRLYEIGDIRPLGNRVERGKAAILLGDRYPPQ